MKNLKNELLNEIQKSNELEPNVTLFIDEQSIFWVSDNGHYVYLESHSGLGQFLDDEHDLETNLSTPGEVGSYGTFWKNVDLESPIHITDFMEQVETITI